MHKLNTWLLKHMFWIALYLAISGIFFQLVLFYELLNSGSRWIYVVFDFTYGHLNFFNADVLNFKFYTDESSYRMRSYLDIVFYVLFLLAALVYKLSNYKVSAVLRFCFSLTFLFSIIGMLFQLYLLGFKFERIGFPVSYTHLTLPTSDLV